MGAFEVKTDIESPERGGGGGGLDPTSQPKFSLNLISHSVQCFSALFRSNSSPTVKLTSSRLNSVLLRTFLYKFSIKHCSVAQCS